MLNYEDMKQLVKPEHRFLLKRYCEFWQLGWQHFFAANISNELKYEKIKLLERALRKDFPIKKSLISQLQQSFIKENLSLYLLLDLLAGWRYLAADKPLTTQTQLTDVISYLTSAPARLIMVLNDENPSTYLPMQSILTAAMFSELTEKKYSLTNKIKLSKKQKANIIKGLLHDGEVILQIVKSIRLKFQLAIFINRKKISLLNNKQGKLSYLDEFKIFLYSVCQVIFVRRRTVERKEY